MKAGGAGDAGVAGGEKRAEGAGDAGGEKRVGGTGDAEGAGVAGKEK